MTRFTIQQAAADADRFPGLDKLAVVDAGGGAGFLFTGRPSQPDVLGLGAVDLLGKQVAIGLTVAEATALRDALTEWIETR
jgi:hypothetical protein